MVSAKRLRSAEAVSSPSSRPSKRLKDRETAPIASLTNKQWRESEKKRRLEEVELAELVEEEAVRQKALAVKVTFRFPFMSLAAELRNMVYRYLVVSPAALHATDGQYQHPTSGLSLAILRVSKQVSEEALALLYTENLVIIEQSRSCWMSSVGPLILRTDTQSLRLHHLRSGYAGRVKHKGVLYPHVFARLRRVRFTLLVYSPLPNTDKAEALTSLWRGITSKFVDLMLVKPDVREISLRLELWMTDADVTICKTILEPFWRLRNVLKVDVTWHYGRRSLPACVRSDMEAYGNLLMETMQSPAGSD